MKDRRRQLRLTLMGIVRILLPGDPKFHEAYLANFSRGGIGIYLHKKVRIGQKLRVAVRLNEPANREEEQEIGAEVTWVSPAGELYMVGLKFERMAKDKYQAVIRGLFP